MLDEALRLAARGWHVFPVAPGGKQPAISKGSGGRGHLDAATDELTIRKWWRAMPDANIGIACGASDIVVLDVDPGHGGDKSLAALVAKYGEAWLDTVASSTPSGGSHYYFVASAPVRNSASKLGPGLDVRAQGGYVVAPPSARADGHVYAWVKSRDPWTRELRPLPSWFEQRAAPPAPGPGAVSVTPGAIAEGSRNSVLASLAGTMRSRGMTEEAIEAALLAENASRCHPPLDEGEVRQVARSIASYPVRDGGSPAGTRGLNSHLSLLSQREEREWPAPPGEAVFIGLAGELVRATAACTEADPIALLVNLLLSVGNAVGPGPHVSVGATDHSPREFAVLVGQTSKARKGESWSPIRKLMSLACPEWQAQSGLSTGEGLIAAVRDPVEKQEAVKEKGRIVDYQTVVSDAGVEDKRLFVMEPELGRDLAVMRRQGNSLSAVMRQAWDTGDLQVMTRSDPLRATGAHISVVAHITTDELRKELPDVEAANGFANRFLFACVKRSRELPEPEPFDGPLLTRLANAIAEAIQTGRTRGAIERTPAARELWVASYSELSAPRPGLSGALCARSEAHVVRLSILYALLTESPVVDVKHLVAAMELWDYCERSVQYIFGDASGDPVADTILDALRRGGAHTRTELSALLGRHVATDRISNALTWLSRNGKARARLDPTAGRPTETWSAIE